MDAQDVAEAKMMAMMGFGGFDSTKVRIWFGVSMSLHNSLSSLQGKPVQGNQEGSVDIKKQRTWRQYMNRSVNHVVRPPSS